MGIPTALPFYFNPRSPWGERQTYEQVFQLTGAFQSTLPVGGATNRQYQRRWTQPISIHAPRGGSDDFYNPKFAHLGISIHAPRGGSDQKRSRKGRREYHFNPRSPWGERPVGLEIYLSFVEFQSTLPVGGATVPVPPCSNPSPYFNPRSPWGERLRHYESAQILNKFQSTLPVGGATLIARHYSNVDVFQSTLPVGGATQDTPDAGDGRPISIHAPRGGSDRPGRPEKRNKRYFNPRSPWGERLIRCFISVYLCPFQSTLPVGGATSSIFLML